MYKPKARRCEVFFSSKHQPSLWAWNLSLERFRSFDPFINYVHVFQSFGLGRAVGHAARKFGNFGDEGLVFLAPINNDFVFVLTHLPNDILGSIVKPA